MKLFILFLEFFKIGAFTFGGGYAMLPLIEQVVLEKKWLSLEQLIDFVAVSESTPGPFAVNISTFIGMKTGGFFGALFATLGVVLPSFVVILIISHFYLKFQKNTFIKTCMDGLRPAVVGLIGSAVISLASSVFNLQSLFTVKNAVMGCIFLICAVLAYRKAHPIIIICISGILGIAGGYLSSMLS